MDSPATPKTPRSQPRSHRKPLQPKNLNSVPPPETLPKPKPKPKPIAAGPDADKEYRRPILASAIAASAATERGADKENRRPIPASAIAASAATELGAGPREASLAEELEALRRRRELLRAERERTDEALRARDATMAAAMRAMERRSEEQRRLESELRRLLCLRALTSSCMISCSVQSLRAQEEERRRIREAESQEPSSSVIDKEVANHFKAQEEEIAT